MYFKKNQYLFQKKNKNNLILTQDYVQSQMPTCEDIHCKCPKCNAKANFSYHGSYRRNISFIREDGIYDFNVCVTRVICNSCGATHALLPDFIAPYKTFSRDSILYVVASAAASSVLKVSEKLSISMELIYSFIAIVLGFFNYADSLNREQNFQKNFNENYFLLNCLTICNAEFDLKFFNRYKWIFLMTKFQNKKPPPITIGVNLIAST
jgi:hypothetical protein